MHQVAGNPAPSRSSRLAIVLSILSAIIAAISMIVSGLNFYFATYRAPKVDIQMGSKIFVTSRPRLGGWFTLANSGAQPTTVTAATLQWDCPSATFKAALTSRNLDEWYFDEKGKRKVATRTVYSWFSPIPLVGHSDTSSILWFTSDEPKFKFSSGKHTFNLTIFNGSSKLSEQTFAVTMTDSDIKDLDPTNELQLDIERK